MHYLCISKQQITLNNEDIMKAINLTKGGFLRRVANYEQSPQEWNFLGDKPAVIDFYAPWCGPCKTLSPIVDELAEEYEGKVDIYKVNVDEEQELAAVFGIRSVPTLIFVPMKGAPQKAAGVRPKSELKEIIDHLATENR